MSDGHFSFDRQKVRRSFSAAADSYDAAAALQNEVADRLLSRLEYIRHEPAITLDIGAGTGYCSEKLLKAYPRGRVLAVDFAEGMLAHASKRGRLWRRPTAVCADAAGLPLADGAVDLIFSNLMLQWCHPLVDYFREFNRAMKPGALLMFSTFGPSTLKELKDAWAEVDDEVHVHDFLDMHDVGDAMVQAGLAEPVVDAEMVTLQYRDVLGLLRDLKAIGANNAETARARGLTGRRTLSALGRAYEVFRDAEGRLPATYEVVYGHAWGASSARQAPSGVIPIFPEQK